MDLSSSKLFINADALSEHHIARVLRGRDEQLRYLRSCAAPAFRGAKPLHALLTGSPGTGKTLTALTVAKELNAKGLLTAYANCMKHGTLYAVLEEITNALHILRSERISTAFKLEQVAKFLKGRPFIVILDEVDKVAPKERAHMLYNLANLGKLGLVCIASNPQFLEALQENVRSRLACTVIEFPLYTTDELITIINGRAGEGLTSSACPDDAALALARVAAGDARTAIQALRRAAVNAGERAGDTIEARDMRNGWKDGAELKRNYVLSLLNDHQRALLRLLQEYGELTSTRLRQEYDVECERLGLIPVKPRTFTHYLTKLTTVSLVEARKGHTKGNLRVFRIVQLPNNEDPAADKGHVA